MLFETKFAGKSIKAIKAFNIMKSFLFYVSVVTTLTTSVHHLYVANFPTNVAIAISA